jgi:N-acetylmuramic acid 6-phosphate etherase
MLSTLIGVRLGHVYEGLMVNLVADNDKLRQRAARIVMRITGAAPETAARALELSDGAVKPAVLIAAGAAGPAEAGVLLGRSQGNLRTALALLGAATPA